MNNLIGSTTMKLLQRIGLSMLLVALMFANSYAEEEVKQISYSTSEEAIFRIAEAPDKERLIPYSKFRLTVNEDKEPTLTTGILFTTPTISGKSVSVNPETPLSVELRYSPVSGIQTFIAGLAKLKVKEFILAFPASCDEQLALFEIEEISAICFSNQNIGGKLLEKIRQTSSLKKLTFENCILIDYESPKNWAPEKLLQLEFSNCSNFLSIYRSINTIQNLLKLTLSGAEISDDVTSSLMGINTLTCFNIDSDFITDEGLEFLKNCEGLEELCLVGKKLTGKALDELQTFLYIWKLKLGIKKDLAKHLQLSKHYPQLEDLTLLDSDVSFREGNRMHQYKRLRSLTVSYVTGNAFCRPWDLLDHITYDLEFNAPKLLRLIVPQASPLRLTYTTNRVASINFGGTRLLSLVINGEICTEDFVEMLDPEICDCIRELGINGARLYENLGSKAVKALYNTPGMIRLSIKNQFFPTDEWFDSIDPQLELEYLCLNNIGGMSDRVLERIEKMKSLVELDLAGNCEITAKGMEKLASLPNLKVLLPTPHQIMGMHEVSIIAKLHEIADVQEREKTAHGGYFRDSTKIIPKVDIDTRDDRFGYSFRYYANSDGDDSTKYIVLAYPSSVREGSLIFMQTEQGTYSANNVTEALLKKCMLITRKGINIEADSVSRIPELAFKVTK